MTNGILNERLHDKARYERVLHLRVHPYFDPQMFCETNPLDGDVVVEKSEFLRKRNLLSVPRIERHPKQIA